MRRMISVLAVLAVVLWLVVTPQSIAAALGAVTGTHYATGNVGYLGTANAGVVGGAGSQNSAGVLGGNALGGTGVVGFSNTGYGVEGQSAGTSGAGIRGFCPNCAGTAGVSTSLAGVLGITSGTGGNANGVIGQAQGNGSGATGVWGIGASPAYAGYFSGNVIVTGTLIKSAGSFRIDHPSDPFNRYLSHSFVESDEMKNIYDGIALLDRRGEAVVEVPEWFEDLNKDFRYQLTCIGEHAPVFIADEVRDGQFRIAGGFEGMKVSWQVTGVRHDPYAIAHPVVVEEQKPIEARGRLLHPGAYGRPEILNVDYERIAVATKGSASLASRPSRHQR